jgi:hypothetical protein
MANKLLLKLGLRVAPRTVRKYMPTRVDPGRGQRVPSQRWRATRRQAWCVSMGRSCPCQTCSPARSPSGVNSASIVHPVCASSPTARIEASTVKMA